MAKKMQPPKEQLEKVEADLQGVEEELANLLADETDAGVGGEQAAPAAATTTQVEPAAPEPASAPEPATTSAPPTDQLSDLLVSKSETASVPASVAGDTLTVPPVAVESSTPSLKD
jgi:hypothetical protein